MGIGASVSNYWRSGKTLVPRHSRQPPRGPMAKIIGMRHHIVHDYFFVDFDVIWTTATVDLAALIEELEKTLPPLGPRP